MDSIRLRFDVTGEHADMTRRLQVPDQAPVARARLNEQRPRQEVRQQRFNRRLRRGVEVARDALKVRSLAHQLRPPSLSHPAMCRLSGGGVPYFPSAHRLRISSTGIRSTNM